jgi:hypothetical protein
VLDFTAADSPHAPPPVDEQKPEQGRSGEVQGSGGEVVLRELFGNGADEISISSSSSPSSLRFDAAPASPAMME